MHTLDDAQLAAILAGLRLLQREGCPADLEEVATSCGRFGLPGDAFLDALCEQVNAGCGEISNWNTGVDDGSGGRVPPDTRPYAVTHLHPTAAVRIRIGTSARPGLAGDDAWIVDTELAEGRPVVRVYEPGQDTAAGTFKFATLARQAVQLGWDEPVPVRPDGSAPPAGAADDATGPT